MSDSLPLSFRPVDRKRLDSLHRRTETPMESADIWFLHSVLCQCFLPYKDPKTDRWQRTNGDFSISLVAGDIKDPRGSTVLPENSSHIRRADAAPCHAHVRSMGRR
jgi:hypothetical protein